jgi:hypothetical protein
MSASVASAKSGMSLLSCIEDDAPHSDTALSIGGRPRFKPRCSILVPHCLHCMVSSLRQVAAALASTVCGLGEAHVAATQHDHTYNQKLSKNREVSRRNAP